MNWKMATKQRTATVRRHDPSSAGGGAAGTGIVCVLSVSSVPIVMYVYLELFWY